MDTIVIESAGRMMNSAVFGQIIIFLLSSDSYIAGNRRENVQTDGRNRCFCIVRSISAFAYLYSDDEFGFIEKRS
jgi:hypothetical protein